MRADAAARRGVAHHHVVEPRLRDEREAPQQLLGLRAVVIHAVDQQRPVARARAPQARIATTGHASRASACRGVPPGGIRHRRAPRARTAHAFRSRRGIRAARGARAAGASASGGAKKPAATSPLAALLPSIDYKCGRRATTRHTALVKRGRRHKISRRRIDAATRPNRSRLHAAGCRHAGGGAVVVPRQEAHRAVFLSARRHARLHAARRPSSPTTRTSSAAATA